MKLIQKGLALLLTLCLLACAALAAGTGFTDSAGTPEAGDITAVAELGLMNGVGAGQFAPDAPMTRAMLSTALFRLAGEKAEDYAVGGDSWYGPAALWAWQAGLVQGDWADFAPGAPLTLADALGMLCRYTGDFDADPSAWGSELAAGLPGGGALTRAQAAALLRRFAETSPVRPLTLLDVAGATPTYRELADRDGGHSYTWIRTLYTDGEITLQEQQSRRYLAREDGYAVEQYWDSYGARVVYLGDRAYGADPGGMGVLTLTPEACRETADSLCAEAGFSYAPEEQIIGLSAGDATRTVKTLVTYEGGSTTYTYTLTADDLRLLETVAEDFDEAGVRFGAVGVVESYEVPQLDMAFVEEIEYADPSNPRVCTLITDPGAETETTETYTVPQGYYFFYPEKAGYAYFMDPLGTVPLESGGLPAGDVTVYLIPITE